jgi:hypothetical protein
MTEKQQINKEIKYEVNLQFITKVRKDILEDPKTKSIVIIQRNEDASIFTAVDEENVLMSFST